MARLDARLKAAGPGGDDWRAFLDWDGLKRQLAPGNVPDLPALDAIYDRYDRGHYGLNLIWFADVREALRHYLVTARAINNPQIKVSYGDLLEKLPSHLNAYAESPTADEALVIGRAVGWLEDAGQAEELVRAIRHCFSCPNLTLEVSAEVIRAGLGRTVDETQPVRDVILGSRVYGTGHVVGEVTVELIPAADCAEIDMVLTTQIDSSTIGYKGPARVGTDALTQMTSRKRVFVDDQHVWGLPAVSRATTDSTITSVRTKGGCPLVERFAWKRARTQHQQAEQIGTRHAEQRVSRRMDQEAGELVGRASEAFREKFRKPLGERRLLPQLLRFSSTQSALEATVLHGGPFGLGTSGPPPTLPADCDLAIRLHESMVNNVTGAALAGMIVEEDRLRAQITEVLGSLPERFQPDEEEEPWAITFAQWRPIWVRFAESRLAVTIRGRKYARGAREYPGMDVTAVYQIQPTEHGFKAVREGPLEIFPPGFVAGQRRLSAPEQALRTLLEKKLGKMFDEELVPGHLVLPGKWKEAGRLALTHWESSGGWVVLGWKWIPSTERQADGLVVTSPAP